MSLKSSARYAGIARGIAEATASIADALRERQRREAAEAIVTQQMEERKREADRRESEENRKSKSAAQTDREKAIGSAREIAAQYPSFQFEGAQPTRAASMILSMADVLRPHMADTDELGRTIENLIIEGAASKRSELAKTDLAEREQVVREGTLDVARDSLDLKKKKAEGTPAVKLSTKDQGEVERINAALQRVDQIEAAWRATNPPPQEAGGTALAAGYHGAKASLLSRARMDEPVKFYEDTVRPEVIRMIKDFTGTTRFSQTEIEGMATMVPASRGIDADSLEVGTQKLQGLREKLKTQRNAILSGPGTAQPSSPMRKEFEDWRSGLTGGESPESSTEPSPEE